MDRCLRWEAKFILGSVFLRKANILARRRRESGLVREISEGCGFSPTEPRELPSPSLLRYEIEGLPVSPQGGTHRSRQTNQRSL